MNVCFDIKYKYGSQYVGTVVVEILVNYNIKDYLVAFWQVSGEP